MSEEQVENVEEQAPVTEEQEAATPEAKESPSEELPSAEELKRLQKDLSKGFSILGNREKELEAKLKEIEGYESKLSQLEKYEKLNDWLQYTFSGDPDKFRQAVSWAAQQSNIDLDQVIDLYKREASDDPQVKQIVGLENYIKKLESKLSEFDKKWESAEKQLTQKEQDAYNKQFEMTFNKIKDELNPTGNAGITEMALNIVSRNSSAGRGFPTLEEEFKAAFEEATEAFENYYASKLGQEKKEEEKKTKDNKKHSTLANKPASAVSAKRSSTLSEAASNMRERLKEIHAAR